MAEGILQERRHNQFPAKLHAAIGGDAAPNGVVMLRTDVEWPRPQHGDWWGPWRYNAEALELEYYDARGNYRYGVDLERCGSSRQILDWIFQVKTKRWCTHTCMGHLVEALRDLIRRGHRGGENHPS